MTTSSATLAPNLPQPAARRWLGWLLSALGAALAWSGGLLALAGAGLVLAGATLALRPASAETQATPHGEGGGA